MLERTGARPEGIPLPDGKLCIGPITVNIRICDMKLPRGRSGQSVLDRRHATQEPHTDHTGSLMNWLRAAVLGANDGIVSVAGLVVGVAGATESRSIIFTAGLAGL